MPVDVRSSTDLPPRAVDLEAECLRVWRHYLALVGAEIERRWTSTQDEARAIYRHALFPPGKLLRPLLGLESAVAVGGTVEQVLPAAVGGECGHVASLIHDDIIDGDDTRRGRPSVQHQFGVHRAILAGDRLIFASFQGLGDCRDRGVPESRIVEALRVGADLGADMCRGAMLELSLGGDAFCGVETYLEMARLKTAAAIRGACQGGAILGGGTPEEVQALGAYGNELGIAFQIRDDLLAYDSDSPTTGKPATSDLRNRRPTLPVLLAHAVAGSADQRLIEEALAGAVELETAHTRLREILHRTGALAATRRMAEQRTRRAQVRLAALPATPSRVRLAYLAERVVHRDR